MSSLLNLLTGIGDDPAVAIHTGRPAVNSYAGCGR